MFRREHVGEWGHGQSAQILGDGRKLTKEGAKTWDSFCQCQEWLVEEQVGELELVLE